jgi:hypothetical protein
MLCFETNSGLACSTNPSLPTAIQSDQRSSRRVMSSLNPASTHSRRVFEIVTTMGDVPDSAGHEMTVGARDCSPLKAGFLTPKTHL